MGAAVSKLSAVAKRASSEIQSVSDDTLTQLMTWVVHVASPEELTFENKRFHEVRDWLKAHKAATELRVKAIRIECIALRKVGMAGLHDRLLKPTDRKVAAWLATLSDERFKTVLEESTISTSPTAVMRWIVGEDDAPVQWVRERHSEYQYNEASEQDPIYEFGLTCEVQGILEQIVADQEDFTVAEAAERLWNKLVEAGGDSFNKPGDLNNDHDVIPPELAGEPLREVVRRVLRAPGPADNVVIGDEFVPVPHYVTFKSGGDYWKRVPWERADLWQFKMMVELRRAQAARAERVADNMAALYEALEGASAFCESTRVQDLIGYADLQVEDDIRRAA